MSVSNLTGTTWEFNSTVRYNSSQRNFNINFTSNSTNYIKISIEEDDGDSFMNYYISQSNSDMAGGGYSGFIEWWEDNAYKTISITGGTDVTNSTLISWLEANATQASTGTTYEHILKGGNKVQVDSAIRDGEGVKISTNYAKKSELPTNKSASSGGTDTSLVTTGDKYTWNNKQSALPTTSTAGKVLKSTSTAGTVEWGDAGSSTTVKINGTSITSSGVADIKTNGTYNASTNKIATMSDIPSTSSLVSNVSYDSSSKKLQQTKNGSTTDVVTFGSNAFNSTTIPTSVNGLSGGTISSTTTINGDMIANYVAVQSAGHETTSTFDKYLTLSTTNYVRYRTKTEMKSDLGVPSIWSGTQQQYDAITNKDSNTYYFIQEE